MNSHIVASILFSVFSLSVDALPADINTRARERIEKLVVEPLQERSIVWRPAAFSRAIIRTKPAELRLWTSAELEDEDERRFVPFRIEAAGDDRGFTFTGCYYVASDTAYLDLEGLGRAVPMDEHPLLTLRTPIVVGDETRCRAKD